MFDNIQADLAPVIERIRMREPIGDQIPGVGFTVMKVRVKNRDSQKGKSGGYRLIYWLVSMFDLSDFEYTSSKTTT